MVCLSDAICCSSHDDLFDLRSAQEDQKAGWGKQRFLTGGQYEGEWKGGLMHGKGTLEEHGNVYDGDFVLGMKQGWGTMMYKSGAVEEGQWENGEFLRK